MLSLFETIAIFVPFVLSILGALLSLEKAMKYHSLILVLIVLLGVLGSAFQAYVVYKGKSENKIQENRIVAIYNSVVTSGTSLAPFVNPWKETEALPFASKEQLLPEFVKKVKVRITDLVPDGSNYIKEKVFEDCFIMGPAVLALIKSIDIKDCRFGKPNNGDSGSLWITVPEGKVTVGIIGLLNVKFNRCYFLNISFIGLDEDKKKFMRGLIQTD